jgi:hypothetical protein
MATDERARCARDAARRRVDEEVAAVRTKLTNWFEFVEGLLSVEFKLALRRVEGRGKNRYDEAGHWLARMALLIHEAVLTTLEPKVTDRQLVASVFKLADVEKDVRYYVSQARAALRKPLGRLLILVGQADLVDLITSAAHSGEE